MVDLVDLARGSADLRPSRGGAQPHTPRHAQSCRVRGGVFLLLDSLGVLGASNGPPIGAFRMRMPFARMGASGVYTF